MPQDVGVPYLSREVLKFCFVYKNRYGWSCAKSRFYCIANILVTDVCSNVELRFWHWICGIKHTYFCKLVIRCVTYGLRAPFGVQLGFSVAFKNIGSPIVN